MPSNSPVSYTHLDVYKRQVYDHLFENYKRVYNSLKDTYIKANGQRFKGEEE